MSTDCQLWVAHGGALACALQRFWHKWCNIFDIIALGALAESGRGGFGGSSG
jgi:hypothetical protein